MRLAPVFEDYINIKKEVCGMSSCGHQVEGKHSAEKRIGTAKDLKALAVQVFEPGVLVPCATI